MAAYDIQAAADAIALAAACEGLRRAEAAVCSALDEALQAVERLEGGDSALALVVTAMDRVREARRERWAAYTLVCSPRLP
jgi:hypothetical protein